MKFLCVPCDEQMKLIETKPPDRGSMTVVFSCPACSYEIALLTNPYETQLVSSLGVEVGPREAGVEASAGESKCPFSGMVQEVSGSAAGEAAEFPWTPEARERLMTIPEFVRPMAKTGIEKFARDNGYVQVDPKVLDEAREFFAM